MHECTNARNAGHGRPQSLAFLHSCIFAFVHFCTLSLVCILSVPSVASAQTRDWPSERPPRSLPARDIKFPPYEIQTLPNGLQVVAVLHHPERFERFTGAVQ